MTVKNAVTNTHCFGFTSDLIDLASDASEFSNSAGTVTSTPGAGPFGETVLTQEITVEGNNPTSLLTGKFYFQQQKGVFSRFFRVNDLSKFTNTNTVFWRAPATGTGSYQYTDSAGSGSGASENAQGYKEFGKIEEGEWILTTWKGSQTNAAGGAPAYDSNTLALDGMTLQTLGTDTGDTGLVIDWSTIRGNCHHSKAVVSFSFDDSNSTDFTVGLPILQRNGYTATSYTITSKIGTAGFLTLDQLHGLQNAGWIIGSHGIDTEGFNNLAEMTEAEQRTELTAVKEYMQKNGFRGWAHYSYPEGEYNNWTTKVLNELGFLTARDLATAATAPYVMPPGFPLYFIRGLNTSLSTTGTGTYDASIITDAIDQAIEDGAIVNLFTHGLLPVTTSNGHTDPDAYAAIVKHVKEKEQQGLLEVVTTDEMYKEATGQYWRAVPGGAFALNQKNRR